MEFSTDVPHYEHKQFSVDVFEDLVIREALIIIKGIGTLCCETHTIRNSNESEKEEQKTKTKFTETWKHSKELLLFEN